MRAVPIHCLTCDTRDPSRFYESHKSQCKACRKDSRTPEEWREIWRRWAANRTKADVRIGHLYKYGLNAERYDALLASQGGGCAVCGKQSVKPRGLSVDHDHATGAVRGLLCGGCNAGLGRFLDSYGLLVAAAAYLKRKAS